jgi:spermidine synthase
MEEEIVVIVVEGGMVTEVYSGNANEKIIIVDIDNRKIGEDSITEFTWPDTQFDDERVEELLKDH